MCIPTIDTIKTGQRITTLRKDAGLAVRELQDIFCFASPNAIYKWQNGAALPTLDNLVVLAQIFHVSMDEIIVVHDMNNTPKSA